MSEIEQIIETIGGLWSAETREIQALLQARDERLADLREDWRLLQEASVGRKALLEAKEATFSQGTRASWDEDGSEGELRAEYQRLKAEAQRAEQDALDALKRLQAAGVSGETSEDFQRSYEAVERALKANPRGVDEILRQINDEAVALTQAILVRSQPFIRAAGDPHGTQARQRAALTLTG